jgi:VWFA-related protein
MTRPGIATVLAASVAIGGAVRPARVGAVQQQFRASVDVVELNVLVTSGRRIIGDLTAKDFEATDNGVKQQVISVTRESQPIDVTMLVDTSQSLTESMVRSIVSAVNRIRERLRPEDRVSVVAFNHRIQERLALLPPPAATAIDIGRPTGQTSLNDAMAVVMAQRPVSERRQMAIAFTDGYDSTSFLTEADLMNVAGRSSTTMFIVAKGFGTAAPFFQQLTEATGGITQMISPYTVEQSSTATRFVRNDNMLDESFLKAFEDFRSSYVVRYTLAGVPRPGWHAVTVKVTRPGRSYLVRTRTGYMGG